MHLIARHKRDDKGEIIRIKTGRMIPKEDKDGNKYNVPETKPIFLGMEIKVPPGERKHLGRNWVMDMMQKGVVEMTGDTIMFNALNGTIEFKIDRQPGRYCLHCGEKLPDDDNSVRPGELARKHVEDKHKGKKSPDPERWPAGYEFIRYYDCSVMEVNS